MKKKILFVFVFLSLFSITALTAENDPPLSPTEQTLSSEIPDANISPSTENKQPWKNEQSVDFKTSFKRMLLALAGIIVLVIITFWMLRRLMHSRTMQDNSSKTIKILEKRALSSKSVLYLIEVNNEKVLISESQHEIRPLHALNLEP